MLRGAVGHPTSTAPCLTRTRPLPRRSTVEVRYHRPCLCTTNRCFSCLSRVPSPKAGMWVICHCVPPLSGDQKCDGVRPVCGCCARGRRPGQCDYDPPEGRAFRLQQRIQELEQTIHAIESQSRRRARRALSTPGSSAGPSAAPSRAVTLPNPGLLSSSTDYAQPPQIIAPNQLPASVDWFPPSMELASPGLHASYGQSLSSVIRDRFAQSNPFSSFFFAE